MKNMTLPVAVAVAIIGCVLAVSANVTTTKINDDLEKERYKRMLTEEQLQQAKNDVSRLKAEITDSQAKIQSIEKILNKGKTATRNLEDQLSAAKQQKVAIEQELMKLKSAQQAVQIKLEDTGATDP